MHRSGTEVAASQAACCSVMCARKASRTGWLNIVICHSLRHQKHLYNSSLRASVVVLYAGQSCSFSRDAHTLARAELHVTGTTFRRSSKHSCHLQTPDRRSHGTKAAARVLMSHLQDAPEQRLWQVLPARPGVAACINGRLMSDVATDDRLAKAGSSPWDSMRRALPGRLRNARGGARRTAMLHGSCSDHNPRHARCDAHWQLSCAGDRRAQTPVRCFDWKFLGLPFSTS